MKLILTALYSLNTCVHAVLTSKALDGVREPLMSIKYNKNQTGNLSCLSFKQNTLKLS